MALGSRSFLFEPPPPGLNIELIRALFCAFSASSFACRFALSAGDSSSALGVVAVALFSHTFASK